LVADNKKDLENIRTLSENITESRVDTCVTSEISELEHLRSSLDNMVTRLAGRIADLKEALARTTKISTTESTATESTTTELAVTESTKTEPSTTEYSITALSTAEMRSTLEALSSMNSSIVSVIWDIKNISNSSRTTPEWQEMTCFSFIEHVKNFYSIADKTRFAKDIKTLETKIANRNVSACDESERRTLKDFIPSLENISTRLSRQFKDLREKGYSDGYGQCVDDESPIYDPRYKVDLGKYFTPSLCIYYCQREGFLYAGLRNKSCYCGNTDPPASKRRDKKECDIKCEGDSQQFCGGNNKMTFLLTFLPLPCEYGGCNDCEEDACKDYRKCRWYRNYCDSIHISADQRCFPDDWKNGACPYLRGWKMTDPPDEITTKENYRACWEYCKQLDIEGNRKKEKPGSKAPESDRGCYAWSFDNLTNSCRIYNKFYFCHYSAERRRNNWFSGATCH